jgi:ankyrin repeat protein
MLIAAGADLEARNEKGESALMYAACCDSTEMAEMLVKAGAKE